MAKVHLNRAKAILFAENAMKRDLVAPIGKALAYAKISAPKDSGRMAAALRARTRKVNGRIEADIGIFNSLREGRRRGEKAPRPTLAQVLVWMEGGRPAIRTPAGRPGPMKFRPKGGKVEGRGYLVVTNFVEQSDEDDFLIRALERVARRYGAGVDEHI